MVLRIGSTLSFKRLQKTSEHNASAANPSTVCGAIATDTKVTFVLSQYALADSPNANKQDNQPTTNNLRK